MRCQPSLKGVHGDITDADGIDLEGKLNQQEKDDEQAAMDKEQRKRDAETRRKEKEELAEAKKRAAEAERAMERGVTELLKSLRFIEANDDTFSASQLGAFVKMNKAQLRDLDVDLSSSARKSVMPQLVAKVPAAQGVEWVSAPHKALPAPAPPADNAVLPPPAREAAAASPPRERPDASAAQPSSVEGTPTKPDAKRAKPAAEEEA